MQFFVLRVASNKEDRVREALLRKVKIEAVEDVVGRILVPTERVRSMKGGVRKESDRKLYPGYVFIELTLDKNGMIPERSGSSSRKPTASAISSAPTASPRRCPRKTRPRCSRKPSVRKMRRA